MSIRNRLVDELAPYRLPPVPVSLSLVTTLLWLAMIRGWLPMPGGGMETSMPMSAPGMMETMATNAGLDGAATYLLFWGVMMAAMMYPAMTPFVRRYADALGEHGDLGRVVPVAVFLGTYSLVWTATGVVPLAVDALVGIHGVVTASPAPVVGGTMLVAGLYQFSDWKLDALVDCCCEVVEPATGALGAVRDGLRHGLRCVRCTWPLFALMTVVGSMNVFWMLLVTAVVTVERAIPWREEYARTVGAVLVVGAAGVLLFGVPVFP